jgi:FkbM family methyltransferase
MHIHRWIEQNVPKNGIVIEAGSWNGADTWFFSQHLTHGKVYSFEPFPLFYYETYNRISGLPNVELSPHALAEKTQPYIFYVSEIEGKPWCSSSIMKPKEHLVVNPHVKFDKQTQVFGINLDEWFESKKLDHIDMMWLDLQGAEPSVLKAAPNILSKTKYIYSEVSFVENYEGVMLYDEYKKFLQSKGFEVIHEDCHHADQGDVLFSNKNM